MSKSSNNSNSNSLDNFLNQQQALDHYVNLLEDFNLRITTLSKTLEDSIESVAKREVFIKDLNNMTKVEIREYFNSIKKTLKEMGIELTKEAEGMLKGAEKSAIATAQRTGKMSFENLNNKTINNTLTNILKVAEAGALQGKNSVTIKDFTQNKNAMAILKEINAKLGKKNDLDSFGYKLKDFFTGQHNDSKKNLQNFGKNLIEGLAASKFVGGAITDGIKLLGLLGNNWLSDKGPVGQILGKILVVLTQATASILSSSFISGLLGAAIGGRIAGVIGKGFTKGFTALKGLFGKGIGGLFGKGALAVGGLFGPKIMTTQMARSTLSAGSIFRDSATGKLKKVVEGAIKADGTKSLRTVAIKEGASKGLGKGLAKGAGKTLLKKIPVAGLLAGGAFAAGRAMHGDWSGAGLELLSGLASIVPGWGTAASLAIDGALMTKDLGMWGKKGVKGTVKGGSGKLGGYAIGAGAVLGGSGILLVNLFNLLKNYFGKQEKDKEESKNFWQDFVNAFKNSKLGQLVGLGGTTLSFSNKKNTSIPEGAQKKNIISGVTDNIGATSLGNLKIAKDGSILNLHKLTQDQASKALQAYEKADPTSFNNLYEWADSKHAHFGSFSTDAVKKNAKGQTTGALMYKGASADLDALRSKLVDAMIKDGVDPAVAQRKANALGFTSGKLTGSNKSHGVGGWHSHNNPYGLAFDLGGGKAWSTADYKKYGKVVADFYGTPKSKGGASQQFSIAFEEKGQGKSTGKHYDAKAISNYKPAGAVENEKQASAKQKVKAEQHSIEAEAIYAKMAMNRAFDEGKGVKAGEELYEKTKAGASGSAEDIGKYYEKALKEYNVKYDKNKNIWIQTDAKGNQSKIEVAQADPDGNKDFRDAMLNISKIANVGV